MGKNRASAGGPFFHFRAAGSVVEVATWEMRLVTVAQSKGTTASRRRGFTGQELIRSDGFGEGFCKPHCSRTRKNRATDVRGTVNVFVANVPKDTHCVVDGRGALSNSKGGAPPIQSRVTFVPERRILIWMASCAVIITASYAGV